MNGTHSRDSGHNSRAPSSSSRSRSRSSSGERDGMHGRTSSRSRSPPAVLMSDGEAVQQEADGAPSGDQEQQQPQVSVEDQPFSAALNATAQNQEALRLVVEELELVRRSLAERKASLLSDLEAQHSAVETGLSELRCFEDQLPPLRAEALEVEARVREKDAACEESRQRTAKHKAEVVSMKNDENEMNRVMSNSEAEMAKLRAQKKQLEAQLQQKLKSSKIDSDLTSKLAQAKESVVEVERQLEQLMTNITHKTNLLQTHANKARKCAVCKQPVWPAAGAHKSGAR